MNALITFDVSSNLTKVKEELIKIGYWARWTSNEVYNLPNNVLWKPNCELLQAKNEVINTIHKINSVNPESTILLERCIVLSVNPWEGITGNPV